MVALKNWLLSQGMNEQYAEIAGALIAAIVIAVLSLVVNVVAKTLIRKVIHPIVRRSQTKWDDAFVDRKVLTRLSHLAPALVIHAIAPVAFGDFPALAGLIESLSVVYFIAVGIGVIFAFLDAVLDVYRTFGVSERIDLKGLVQVFKIIVFIVGGILVLAELIGESPLVFFTGIGASTAILMLVFKDTILGLVAGVQLTANKMVRRGDWIEMPKYGVDGDVIDVSLTTIKVQNWDKTISTVPPYALVTDSFKNWRGMSESGGRRIKRSISIDMTSIRFLDEESVARFKKIRHVRDHLERKLTEIGDFNQGIEVDETYLINGRHLTNIGTFRAYLEGYLRNHPKISQDLTFLVRQLSPGPEGLPIEIYVFSNDQDWARYEGIQADIFDHILAVIPLFDLRVFQSPAGSDVKALAARS